MRKIKTYLIIIFLSVIFSLYFFESFLLIKEKVELSQKIKSFKNNTGKDFDKRTKLEIYEDLKQKDKNITISFNAWSKMFLNKKDIFPLSGLSNKKSIHCNENGYYSIYSSDRYGFNNPNEEWDKKNLDYLIVGDSFVHGACVNRPNDISSVLRSLSGNSALNLGISGNGPLTEYATLREYIKPNIKKIIWIYYEGYDLQDLIFERNNFILKKYLKDKKFSQDLKKNNKKKDEVVERITNIELARISEKYKDDKRLKYKILKFIRLDKTKNSINFENIYSPSIDDSVFKDFEKILKQSKDLSINNGSKFYFVYLPEYYRYTKKYNEDNYEKILEITNKLNISTIDLKKELFDKEESPSKLFPFELGGHLTIEGYKKVTEKIYENLISSK